MKTSSSIFLFALALSACGPRSTVVGGTYVTERLGSLPGSTLVVELKAKTASLTLSGATTPIVLQLSGPQWTKSCVTNFSSVLVETWTVSPDPAVLGTITLSGPRLLAGCGEDIADPDTVFLMGTELNSSLAFLLLR